MDSDRRHDYTDAAAQLVKRGATADCMSCGATRWKQLGPLGNLLVALPATTPGELLRVRDAADLPASLVCYVFVCGNCGFVRLHSADDLDEAL